MSIKNVLKTFFSPFLKKKVQRYIPTEEFVDLSPGDKVGIYGSSHGNIIALKKITEIMIKDGAKYVFHLGDIMDEHAGYIECFDYVINHDIIKPVVGNHDLLIVNKDEIHNYEQEYIDLALKAEKHFNRDSQYINALMNMPSKITTPFFSLVHESVEFPYYAKITKLKKKSSVYGKTPDENLDAVFNSTILHPYFTGSDHKSYIINTVKLKKKEILPNTQLKIKGAAIVSVPSVSLSKDKNYTHGYCMVECNEDKSIKIEFFDLPEMLIENGEVI